MHTPDQPINPPNDDRFKDCIVCNGFGKTVREEFHEEHGMDPNIKPGPEDLEKCTSCGGEGVVPIEPWENEW